MGHLQPRDQQGRFGAVSHPEGTVSLGSPLPAAAPDLTYLAMTKDYRIMDRRDGSFLPDDHLSEEDKRRIDPYTRAPAAQAPVRKRDRLRNWFRNTTEEYDRELDTMSSEWRGNARRALGGR
jgi:hypothetical protein